MGKHLIYVDESTFHQWQVPSRVWVRKDSQIVHMPSNRGMSVTVIGAISEKMGLVHYKIFHGSNNAQTFSAFTTELLRKIKGQATVYMDNYKVHYSHSVKDLFTDRVE